MFFSHNCSNASDRPHRLQTPEVSEGETRNGVGEVKKVLVVDDEPDTANLASMLLVSHGFEVVTEYSGRDALRALEQDTEIDAVFSDIMMPGMTGLELLNVITKRFSHVKIVLTSGYTFGYASVGHAVPSLLIAKPYDIDDVISLLRS